MSVTLLVEPRDGDPFELRLDDPWLVVAGYTGRDEESVRAHIRELADHGVPEPPAVPMLWPLPGWLLQIAGRTLQVDGASTSGEAEPVLIRLPEGRLLVGIGSDHTDRDRERDSIQLSKLVCPKVIGPSVWPYEDVADAWDELRLGSRTGPLDPYQDGRLAHIRPPHELLGLVDRSLRLGGERPLVLFLGTVPLSGGAFAFEPDFAATLTDARNGRTLSCEYRTDDVRLAEPAQ